MKSPVWDGCRKGDCMDLVWLRKKKVKMWLEIGLAVLLAVFLGTAGAKLSSKEAIQPKADAAALAEAENQSAKQAAEKKTGTDKSGNGEAVKEVIADGQYPIMGKSQVTAEEMVDYFYSAGVEYPTEALSKGGADSIETFCNIYMEEAEAEGVRPEVAFAQTLKETGWLQYGGDASVEQFNFAGIGTTGGGVPGNSYPDVRTGVRAQIQHLKAYATTDTLTRACVDDRYEYVIKGSAPYVEWLGKNENPEGQGWATAENYGPSIVEMIRNMTE